MIDSHSLRPVTRKPRLLHKKALGQKLAQMQQTLHPGGFYLLTVAGREFGDPAKVKIKHTPQDEYRPLLEMKPEDCASKITSRISLVAS